MKQLFVITATVKDDFEKTIVNKFCEGRTRAIAEANYTALMKTKVFRDFLKLGYHINKNNEVMGDKKKRVMLNKQIAHERWCDGFQLTIIEMHLMRFILLEVSRKDMIALFFRKTNTYITIGTLNTHVLNLLHKLSVSKDAEAFELYNA